MDKEQKPDIVPELLGQMLDCVGSPVFAKGRDHRFVYLNKAAADFLGHTNEVMLGKTDTAFFPEEQVRVFWERDDEVFRTGKEDVNEETITDAAGRRHTIVTRKRLFRDHNGDQFLVGVINDITELREANTKLSLFRNVLEHSNDAMFILAPETGAVLDVNDTACLRLGYAREELLKMSVPDFSTVLDAAGNWRALSEKALASGSLLQESVHKRSDGSTFPVEVSVSSAVLDDRKYILVSARDITDRKRMQEAVNEVNTLRGLIPICAKCKKIRDDKGFWQKVETYLEKRSNARFTHGLCKDCMHELYGKESWFKDES